VKHKTGMTIYQEIAEEENPDKETKLRYLEYVEVRDIMKFIDQRTITTKQQSDFNLGFQYALLQLQKVIGVSNTPQCQEASHLDTIK
jgi:hypothetical protein